MFKRILLPTDFSASAEAALAVAKAHFPEAELCLLHVIDPKRIAASLDTPLHAEDVRNQLKESALRQLETLKQGNETCLVEIGSPVETILAQAEDWRTDLIVMGTHGRTGIAHFLNGSVAETVVRLAKLPVLIAHEHDKH